MNDPVLRLKLQQQVFKTGIFRDKFVKAIVKIRILLFSTYKNKVMRFKPPGLETYSDPMP